MPAISKDRVVKRSEIYDHGIMALILGIYELFTPSSFCSVLVYLESTELAL